MRKLLTATACLILSMSVPAIAQETASPFTPQSTMAASHAGAESTAKPTRVSALRAALSEAAILRCQSALKLKAEQKKYWPAVASALRALAREPVVTEAVVQRLAPAVTPLLASLDDHQRQVAMGFAQRMGLTQYASLF